MLEDKDFDYCFKIVNTGSTAVGKSSVFRRYANDSFSFCQLNTIGVDFLLKNITYENKKIKLHLWDTAGQERFKAIASLYYRGCDCILFTYDITSITSFNQMTSWINAFNEENYMDNENTQNTTNDNDNVIKVLLGTKSDLVKLREVSYDLGQSMAKQYDMLFFETSALNNSNINEMFDAVVKRLFDDREKRVKGDCNKGKVMIIGKDSQVREDSSCKRCCK